MSMLSLIPRLPDSLQSYLSESYLQIQKAYTALPPPAQQYLESAAKYTHIDQVPPNALAGTVRTRQRAIFNSIGNTMLNERAGLISNYCCCHESLGRLQSVEQSWSTTPVAVWT